MRVSLGRIMADTWTDEVDKGTGVKSGGEQAGGSACPSSEGISV